MFSTSFILFFIFCFRAYPRPKGSVYGLFFFIYTRGWPALRAGELTLQLFYIKIYFYLTNHLKFYFIEYNKYNLFLFEDYIVNFIHWLMALERY